MIKNLLFLLLLLGMVLSTGQSYAKNYMGTIQFKKKDALHYFGAFLDSKAINSLTSYDGGEECLQIPLDLVDNVLNENFKTYLTRHKVQFIQKMGNIDDKYISLLNKIWFDIPSSLPIPNSMRWYIYWENHRNQKNDSGKRQAPLFSRLDYYEIPGALVTEMNSKKKNINSANEMKHGRSVIWPIHPEDEKYGTRIESYLQSEKYDPATSKKNDLFAILTSTNLVLVFNPHTNNLWFVKLSRSNESMNIDNEKVNKELLEKGILIADHIVNVNKHIAPFFMNPVDSSLGYFIKNLDLAVIVQEYPRDFMEGKKYLLPATAALNMKIGAEIATKNGSKRPDYFWRIHFNILSGMAQGEMLGLYGLGYETSDLSKFMIELDDKLSPTGKMYLGDLYDTSIFRKYFKNNEAFLKQWPSGSSHKKLRMNFDHFSNLISPSWILDSSISSQLKRRFGENFLDIPSSGAEVHLWKKNKSSEIKELKSKLFLQEKIWSIEFFSFFQATYYRISGVKLSTIAKRSISFESGSVANSLTRSYPSSYTEAGLRAFLSGRDGVGFLARKEKFFSNYLSLVPCFQGEKNSAKGAVCSDELFEIYGKMMSFHKYYNQKICGNENPFDSLEGELNPLTNSTPKTASETSILL